MSKKQKTTVIEKNLREEGEESGSNGSSKSSSSSDSESSSSSSSSGSRSSRSSSNSSSGSSSSTSSISNSESENESNLATITSTSSINSQNRKGELKATKLRKFGEQLKEDIQNAQHKLEKIHRAYKKAETESNKINMKKCKKFIIKYEQKIERFKKKAKKTAVQIARLKALQNELAVKKNNLLVKQQQQGDLNSPNSSPRPFVQPQPAEAARLRLPYPVINDKRDPNTILATLESKSMEIMKKRETNRQTLEQLMRDCKMQGKRASTDIVQHIDKLNKMDTAYDSQQEKLVRQIEYVKLSLNLEALRTQSLSNVHLMMSNGPLIEKMSHQLNDMFVFMKSENAKKIRETNLINEAKANESQLHISTTNSPPASKSSGTKIMSPTEKIQTLAGIVNNSLATLLAHTAASAHSTAAITSYAYFYYNYYNQTNPDAALNLVKEPAVLPLKAEIEKASSAFSRIKDRISNFFVNTQKIEQEKVKRQDKSIAINVDKASGLNKIVTAYTESNHQHDEQSDEDSSFESQIEEKNMEKCDEMPVEKNDEEIIVEEAKKISSDSQEESDTESVEEVNDDDYLFADFDNQCELEIATTSELKSSNAIEKKFLFPSMKASYFPIKASLENDVISNSQLNTASIENFIVAEKSNYGLTLLGSGHVGRPIGNKNLADILYG